MGLRCHGDHMATVQEAAVRGQGSGSSWYLSGPEVLIWGPAGWETHTCDAVPLPLVPPADITNLSPFSCAQKSLRILEVQRFGGHVGQLA